MGLFNRLNRNLARLRTTRSTLFFTELSRTERIAAVVGVLVLAALVLRSAFMVDWPAYASDVAFFGALYLTSALLSVRVPQGIYLGLTSLVIITMALATSLNVTLVIGFVAMLVVTLLRTLLHPLFGVPVTYRWALFIENLGQTVLEIGGVLVGGLLFHAVGGPTLEMRGSLPALFTFAIFLSGYILTREGLTLARLSLLNKERNPGETYELLARLLIRQYVWVLLAPILTIVYQSRADLHLLLFVLVLLGNIQIFNINRQFLRLRYRVDDLRRLNLIGQRLSTELTLDGIIETLRTALGELLDVSGLYIGLWDRETNSVYFPVRYERGQRLPPDRRPFGQGITEHILRTGESVVLNGSVVPQAEALGVQVKPNLPHPRSFIGVPMMVGSEAVGVIGLRHYEQANIYTEDDIYLLEALATQTANAIQNVRNFERSEKKSSELASLSTIAASLAATLDLQQVIDEVCQAVIGIADASKSAVFLLDENTGTIDLHGSVGLSQQYIDQSRQLSLHAVRNHAAREGDVLLVENIFTDERFASIRDLARREGFTAVLDIPLRTPDGTLGNLTAYFETPRQFSPAEIELLSTMASQMAVVVSNAKLFEDMRERQTELEALYSFTTELTGTLSIDGVCETVASAAHQTLDAHEALVMITTENNRDLQVRVRAFEGQTQTLSPEDISAYTLTINTMSDLLGNTDLLQLTREDDLPEALQALMANFGLQRVLLAPIHAYRDIIGLIVVGYEHSRPTPASVERLAQSIAVQAAVALQNARLFEYTDVMLAVRLEEISALEEIVRRMTRRLDMYAIIEHVAHAAANATGADHAEVAVLNETGTAFDTIVYFRDGDTHVDENVRDWPIDRGLVGQALRTKRTVLVDDVTNTEGYVEIHAGTRSELVAPILLDNKPLGVINLESHRLQSFSSEQAHFISNLAEHAAIAIHNARLFERLQRGRAEFRALRGVAVDLLRQNDLRTTLQTIAQAALNNTHAANIHIYLYDAESTELTFGTSLKRSGETDDEFAPPRPDGLTARVARSGESIIIHNPGQHPLMNIHTESDKWEPIGGIAGLPLKRGDEVIGVFNIAFSAENAMTEDMLRFLELLATQASVAITDAQLGEQTRAQRDQLAAILESIQDGILVMDNSGRILLTNARLGYLLNVRVDDLEGKNYRELMPRLPKTTPSGDKFSEEAINALRESISERPYEVTERYYQFLEPKFRAIEEISLPVTDEHDTVFGRVFIVRDITQQVELDKYRQDMSGMMVHDLRSPLSGVITGLEMVVDELSADHEPDMPLLNQVVHIALDRSNYLLDLIGRILDINKLEAGEMPLKMEDANLGVLAASVVTLLRNNAQPAGIRLILDAEDVPDLVCDASLIERVIINLVDNAIRYSVDNGQVIVRIKVEAAAHTLTVIDTGSGVPNEFKERVFDRFYQVEGNPKKRGAKGSGLGLNFAKLAVEAHGGRIWVTDAHTGGAAFHFSIPTGLPRTPPDQDDDENTTHDEEG